MPSPLAPEAIAPQLWHLGERRKQVFSISAAGTEGGSESASEERRFRSIAVSGAAVSLLALVALVHPGDRPALEQGAWCLPPAVLFGILSPRKAEPH